MNRYDVDLFCQFDFTHCRQKCCENGEKKQAKWTKRLLSGE